MLMERSFGMFWGYKKKKIFSLGTLLQVLDEEDETISEGKKAINLV